MNVVVSGDVFRYPSSGIAKSVFYLYEACKKVDPEFNVICFSDEGKPNFNFDYCFLQYKKNFFEKFFVVAEIWTVEI